MKRSARPRRSGMTLLEVITATTLMATLMASVVVLVRSSYATWQAHEADMVAAESAYAVLRHVVRDVRQATAVTEISTAGDTTGNLSLTMDSGDIHRWQHLATGEVMFGDDPLIPIPTELLANNVNQMTFVAYEADGTTPTTVVDDIHSIRCTVQVDMPAGGGTTRNVSCTAWLRTF